MHKKKNKKYFLILLAILFFLLSLALFLIYYRHGRNFLKNENLDKKAKENIDKKLSTSDSSISKESLASPKDKEDKKKEISKENTVKKESKLINTLLNQENTKKTNSKKDILANSSKDSGKAKSQTEENKNTKSLINTNTSNSLPKSNTKDANLSDSSTSEGKNSSELNEDDLTFEWTIFNEHTTADGTLLMRSTEIELPTTALIGKIATGENTGTLEDIEIISQQLEKIKAGTPGKYLVEIKLRNPLIISDIEYELSSFIQKIIIE